MNNKLLILALAALGFGCQNVQRSMVFSTGTNIGVELSTNPNSESPVKFVLGYKRAEVLFDPILEDTDDGMAAKDRAHSVLAKLAGGIQTDTSGNYNISQWFASGRAAEILAGNGGAAALTDNPAIAKTVATGSGLSGEDPVDFFVDQVVDVPLQIENSKDSIPENKRERADKILSLYNSSAILQSTPDSVVKYKWSVTNKKLEANSVALSSTDFKKFINYRSAIKTNISNLRSYFSTSGATYDKSTVGVADDKLLSELTSQQNLLKSLNKTFMNDQKIAEAVSLMNGGK